VKVVVSTPTGNIGRVLTDRLLQAGTELTLIARDPDKVRAFAERGATVLEGTLTNEEFVREATRGADAFFFVTPADYKTKNAREFQNELGKIAAAAVRANEIPRVINISSVGAQLDSGTGLILGLHDNEQHLDAAASNITHLRPNMFMENWLGSVETIKGMKSVLLPVPGNAGANLIATQDIGEFAAGRILDDAWTGRHVVEISGPERLTFDDVARILSKELGEKITHVPVGANQARLALVGLGFSNDFAKGVVDIYKLAGRDGLNPEQILTPENTMKTTFAEFARNVLVPAVRGKTSVS
jgi:uncharacterized protein YbjT (DUF2867 family)